jgi:MoxR-like ATPase
MANSPLAQPFALAIRGLISLGAEEVRGRLRQRSAEPLEISDLEVDADLSEFADLTGGDLPPLPDLDEETELGEGMLTDVPSDSVPHDLFASIVGLESEKRLLRMLVSSPRTAGTHALLIGPPGSAKSEFLRALGTLPDSRYIGARGLSGPGLRAMFLRPESGHAPVILRIDEFDKLEPAMVAPLLELCDGTVTEAVSGSQRDEKVHVHVIAACNGLGPIERLPSGAALLSRFHKLHLPNLSLEERRQVIIGVLGAREGISATDAAEIADLVAPHSSDVRVAEQIAEIWRTDPDLARQRAATLGGAGVVG